MIHKKIPLDEQNQAIISTYILDGDISYQVTKKRPAMIICPGGGYLMTATKEKEAVALEFMAKGYHSFVLTYSTYFKERMTSMEQVPSINKEAYYPKQILELMETIHLIREHAEEWHIDTDNIFVIGFSAGGHIAASLGNRWQDTALTEQLSFIPKAQELKPKGILLAYPMLNGDIKAFIQAHTADGILIKYQTPYIYDCLFKTTEPSREQIEQLDMISLVNADTPPTFIWTTRTDQVIDAKQTTQYVLSLQEKAIECEYHLFEEGSHGLSLATDLYATNDEAINEEVSMWLPLANN